VSVRALDLGVHYELETRRAVVCGAFPQEEGVRPTIPASNLSNPCFMVVPLPSFREGGACSESLP
jgi:hypothetical protein